MHFCVGRVFVLGKVFGEGYKISRSRNFYKNFGPEIVLSENKRCHQISSPAYKSYGSGERCNDSS